AGVSVPGLAHSQTIKQFNQILVTNTAGQSTVTMRLPEGYLLSVGIIPTVAQQSGLAFVRGSLIRALGSGQNTATPLFADHIGGLGPIGWPQGRVALSTEGPGQPCVEFSVGPAAGADFTFTVSANAPWHIVR